MILATLCICQLCLVILNAAQAGPIKPADGGVIDLPMLRDPVIAGPDTAVYIDPRSLRLWEEALTRPEFDLRLQAIKAFVLAHEKQVPNLDRLSSTFVRLLRDDPNLYVRIEAARALIAFDEKEAAPDLLQASEQADPYQFRLIQIVDPALARWDYQPARAVWIKRALSRASSPAEALSAIHSLRAVRAQEARDVLQACVQDDTISIVLRLEAASALGALADHRLVPIAAALIASGNAEHRLMATSILESHNDPDSVAILHQLAEDDDVRVRVHALRLLRQLNPATTAQQYSRYMTDADDAVRLELITAVAAASYDEQSIAVLAKALSDPSFHVRSRARDMLIEAARGNLRDTVQNMIQHALAATDWRTLEQASLVAGASRLNAAANPLLELLTFDRPEVRLAAAGALHELALPSTLPAILQRCQQLSEQVSQVSDQPDTYEAISNETTQLFMAIGQQKYEPADALLRRYIPKQSGFAPMARAAAIYALGKIYEGQPQPTLVEQLLSRVADDNPLDLEAPEVRRFAAISLARMNAREAIDTLQTFYERENSTLSVGGACRWALMTLQQKNLPPLTPVTIKLDGFFLEAAD